MLVPGLLLAAAIAFTPDDAKVAYATMRDFVKECTPRDAGTVRGHLAASWIVDRVSRCGVDADLDRFTAVTPDGEKKFANVCVTLRGSAENAPWIVLVSHFDTKPGIGAGFEGANDGASTTGLLVALAAAIRRGGPLRNNLMLAWTDGEECRYAYSDTDGFQGAKRLVRDFTERNRRVGAAIGLDMLGDRDLGITLPLNVSAALRACVHKAAAKAGCAAIVRDGTDVVRDDFSVFHDAGCPAIGLIDFEYGSAAGLNDYWHTTKDTMDKVSEASLLTSGRLTVEILNLLENGTK